VHRTIAFLRAINVGGHNVRMSDLQRLFEGLGLVQVETFLASGNVIFETPVEDSLVLEDKLEKKLHSALGYEVVVFLRTDLEVQAVAAYQPFSQAELDSAAAFNVAFLKAALDKATTQKLMTLITSIDGFHNHQREIYWICKQKQSESTFSNAVLEKTLGGPSTLRGINTLRKLALKYPTT
jgi:uncharacterized protein (DUF1697 family)